MKWLLTSIRRGWYSGDTVQVRDFPTLDQAIASTGYGSQVFTRQRDGSYFADLSDYRYGESAYIHKVRIEPVRDPDADICPGCGRGVGLLGCACGWDDYERRNY